MGNEPLSGRSKPETGNNKTEYKAHYHLPGLFAILTYKGEKAP